MRAQFRFRIRIVLIFIVLTALLILTRLYFLQIVQGDEYALKADRQFASGGNQLFDRGTIYFTRKDGTLISGAALSSGFLIAINPQTLKDPEKAFFEITSFASSTISHDSFITASGKKSQVYIEVAHRVSEQAGKALSAKKIPGVQVLRERWRYYPGGTLASQSIGIVSYGSSSVLAGRTGLEAKYETTLSRSGDSLYKNFFAELFSNVGNIFVNAKDAREGDIITTIEPEVQTRLTDNIAKVNRRYSSSESGGIIMDPSTGAIIALATYPSYDGNNLQSIDPTLLGNSLVEHVYEFGSIIKPITITSALDAGAITTKSTYDDTGCMKVDKFEICNWDGKARGKNTPVKQIIVQSLNLGASWAARELGQEKFRNYFTKLFGQETGIDLPNENGALIGNLSKPQQVGYDTAAFGQGIAVTPLQMIRALGAIANSGVMVEPHLASGVRLNSGIVRDIEWEEKTPVFSPESTRATTEMMDAFTETLVGGKEVSRTMSVASKTGTSQLTHPDGGYYTDRFFHSFVGFFPSYNPRFIILLYTNDPKNVSFASETLSPTFFDIVRFLINYYEVPPDRGLSSTQ